MEWDMFPKEIRQAVIKSEMVIEADSVWRFMWDNVDKSIPELAEFIVVWAEKERVRIQEEKLSGNSP